MTQSEPQKEVFKAVKQRLSTIQLVIKKDLKKGRIPHGADVDHFVAESKEMDRLCRADWRTAMDRYMDRVDAFQEAMKGEQLDAIEDAFHGLLDCKVACHEGFRKK